MKDATRNKFDDALVRIEQTFDVPRDQVFDAWVQKDLLEEWFAPDGCTLHIARLDVREGGGYHWCVKNPSFGDVLDHRLIPRGGSPRTAGIHRDDRRCGRYSTDTSESGT